MSSATPLNDVQSLNFSFLSLARDAARADPAGACCRFGLSPAQLKTIGDLTPADLMRIVACAGNVPLFAPRDDLDTLLAAPRSVIPILATARTGGQDRRPAERPPG